VVHENGGPEKLSFEDIEQPEVGTDDVLVKVEVAGVNFIDTYHRSGIVGYGLELPFVPGNEGAGVVESTGPDVDGFKSGDRVAWAMSLGSYSEYAAVPSSKLVVLPSGVSTTQGAAVMLQGMTAHYLASSTFPLQSNHTCVIHAGAGGVGLLLTQLAKRRGAAVITTVGTEAKAELSRNAGADHVILYRDQDFKQEVMRITDDEGVEVVYDSVAKETAMNSLACLKRRGTLVLFGNASGPAPAIDPLYLSQNGSLYVTRPTLADHMYSRQDLEWRAGDLFRMLGEGDLDLRMEHKFQLADAAEAHRQLEGRLTTGKVLLNV